MLLNLNISNFAVFENVSINFDSGFNVFTGETGSGKSVLIEALSVITGGRASKDLIRRGKKSALVEAVFDVPKNGAFDDYLKEIGVAADDNDFFIISREVLENGKSINKVNGRAVPLNTIKDIGGFLIDIYGQFGQEKLFKKENHIKLLDSIAKKEISPVIAEYQSLYMQYNKVLGEIEFLEEKLKNKDLRIEQLKYELDEIDDACLEEGEEESLLKEIKKLSNVQELKSSLYEASNILSRNGSSAVNSLNTAYSILNRIKGYDDKIIDYMTRLELFLEELQDIVYDLSDYTDGLEVDQERLSFIENRVSLINRLKRKYGYSIEKIFEYRESSASELAIIEEADSNLEKLHSLSSEIFSKLSSRADKMTKARKTASLYLEKALLKELKDLNMKNIDFKVKIDNKPGYSQDGIDDVEFLISTNVGSDLNSVQKIVSGGEASRIMLAMKKISSDIDDTGTLVFDEIDSGISGKTSQMAGIKMKYISENHQVICVTHSPQIASISKSHYLIEKNVVGNETLSSVKKLDDDKRVYEIARLLSGIKITDKSLGNAHELMEMSNNF
jgi:DNA repair protein RecN (Recombination protein N)